MNKQTEALKMAIDVFEQFEMYIDNPKTSVKNVELYKSMADAIQACKEALEQPMLKDEKGRPMTYWGGLEQPAHKPHEIREHVNRLRDIAKDFGQTQQLRDRISREVLNFHECETLIAIHEALEQPALVCEGCGSTMTDSELAEEKRIHPNLIACCPDRKMVEQPIAHIDIGNNGKVTFEDKPQNCGTGHCSCIECIYEPRASAVNLARNTIENEEYKLVTPKGIKLLCDAVMAMDKDLLEQPAQMSDNESLEPVAWISVKDKLPSKTKQVEVVFYSNPYEWWTGLFTPKGYLGIYEDDVFQYHQHWDDDRYHTVDNVTHWMPLPKP